MHIHARGLALVLFVLAAMFARSHRRARQGRGRTHPDRHEYKREQGHQSKDEGRHAIAINAATSHGNEAAHIPNHMRGIHSAMPTIMRFSVRETKPSGTLLDPPTQAHLSSRLST